MKKRTLEDGEDDEDDDDGRRLKEEDKFNFKIIEQQESMQAIKWIGMK